MKNDFDFLTPGMPDELFSRSQVPMTKEEVRVLTLAKARIAPHHVLWDIGAGTGSISIEAARLLAKGQVYAIERNPMGIDLIKLNAEKFGLNNIQVVEGEAPSALAQLPRPHRIILGGTGGHLREILDVLCEKLLVGGRIVCNAILMETMMEFNQYFKSNADFTIENIQVAVTRMEPVGGKLMMKANNPIFIQTAAKRGD